VSPQHQHPLLIIDQHRHGRPVKMNGVMLEPFPIRDLDIHEPDPNPAVVIDQPLAAHDPPRPLLVRSHTATLPPSIADVHGTSRP
jgi:hypothetical protein